MQPIWLNVKIEHIFPALHSVNSSGIARRLDQQLHTVCRSPRHQRTNSDADFYIRANLQSVDSKEMLRLIIHI